MLKALLLDHHGTDLARMEVTNEILTDGTSAFDAELVERLNEAADRKQGQQFREVHELVIRPSQSIGLLACEVLSAMPGDSSRSPLLRLAMRNLEDRQHSTEADLLSYLLFDGEFLGPLAELGYNDARSHENEFAAFFSDEPFEPDL